MYILYSPQIKKANIEEQSSGIKLQEYDNSYIFIQYLKLVEQFCKTRLKIRSFAIISWSVCPLEYIYCSISPLVLCPSVFQSFYPMVCPSIGLQVCWFVYPLDLPSVCCSICLLVRLSPGPSICSEYIMDSSLDMQELSY